MGADKVRHLAWRAPLRKETIESDFRHCSNATALLRFPASRERQDPIIPVSNWSDWFGTDMLNCRSPVEEPASAVSA